VYILFDTHTWLTLSLLCRRSQADIAAAKPVAAGAAADGSKLNWDTPKEDEDIGKVAQHAKVGTPHPGYAALSSKTWHDSHCRSLHLRQGVS
jgi:hypothetical protein